MTTEHELTTIDGIGPNSAVKLIEMGIETLADLAAASFVDIEDIRGASRQWIEDAQQTTMDTLDDVVEHLVDEEPLDVPTKPEVLPVENKVEPVLAQSEAIPAIEAVVTLQFVGEQAEALYALRDTIARKQFKQGISVQDAVWVVVAGALKDLGLA